MKQYPSIDDNWRNHENLSIVAFDKLDGSNIRAEWNLKQGFVRFGTRKRLLNENDDHLGKAITLFNEKYAEKLPKIFARQKWHHEVVCFFEFYGPNSFAGDHQRRDDHTVTLIDVSVYKQGILPPEDFINIFEQLGIPSVLYRGKPTPDFVKSVREGSLVGLGQEGVICKAANPNGKKTSQPVMFKIKRESWIEKVRKICGNNEKLLEEKL